MATAFVLVNGETAATWTAYVAMAPTFVGSAFATPVIVSEKVHVHLVSLIG